MHCYGRNSQALEPEHAMHNRMCMRNTGTFTRLSYNTNDGKETKWNQYSGIGITLNADMISRMTKGGSGGDPTKLRRWTWACIGGKDYIATVLVSTYRPCHNPVGLHTVWSRQARCFKENEDVKVPDAHALFIGDLCKFFEDLRDKANNVVLGIDANNDV